MAETWQPPKTADLWPPRDQTDIAVAEERLHCMKVLRAMQSYRRDAGDWHGARILHEALEAIREG